MKPGQFPAHPLWWEIIYLHGQRVRGDTVAEWRAAPDEGVLVVRQPMQETYESAGHRFHFTARCHSHDYYWLDDDGLIQQGHAHVAAGQQNIKRGAWADRDEFRAAFDELGQDALFGDEPA